MFTAGILFAILFQCTQATSGYTGVGSLATPFFPLEHMTALLPSNSTSMAITDPTYIKFSTYVSGTAPCAGESMMGASLTGLCQVINSTTSQKITCGSTSACTIDMFENGACTGVAKLAIELTTDGSCQKIVPSPFPGPHAPIYMKTTQVVGETAATDGLAKPYIGGWNDETCSGAAVTYSSVAGCHLGPPNSTILKSFETTCSASGTVESCHWGNSTTCAPISDGTCDPLPEKFMKCVAIPGSSVLKALTYFC